MQSVRLSKPQQYGWRKRRGMLLFGLVAGAALLMGAGPQPDAFVEGVVDEATQTRVTVVTADSEMVAMRVDRETRVTLNGRSVKSRDLKPGDVARAGVRTGGLFEAVAVRIDARRGLLTP
jgi:hypothetical protein